MCRTRVSMYINNMCVCVCMVYVCVCVCVLPGADPGFLKGGG